MAVAVVCEVEMGVPLYVLVEEECRKVLVAAEDVSGFFVDVGGRAPDVVFLGIHEVGKHKAKSENAVLEVINRRQEKIGEYFIGRAVRGGIGPEPLEGVPSTMLFQSFGYRCEYAAAPKIWRRWASGVAIKAGEWLEWPAEHQPDWLHVVQNSWFATNHRAGRYGSEEIIHLDGALIPTKAAFYCSLGEAVNGPGGYFGSNLDAVADCISSNYGEGRLAGVVWRNFQGSQKILGDVFAESMVTLMREFSIDVSTR